METIDIINKLLKEKVINKQQYKTYRGQILSGNEKGCIIGLQRKGLIKE